MPGLITVEIAQEVEKNIITILNKNARNLVSSVSLSSPRAIGDAIQEFLAENLLSCMPKGIIRDFEKDFQRRSMEDMALYDLNDCYYAIDTKTHNKGTQFNMPNLISVKRLANFYRNPTNFFYILLVEYETTPSGIYYSNCHFNPIEHYSWDCLTLGALGWGQIQIANSNHLVFERQQSRKIWMLKLCDIIEQFYNEEIGKLRERIAWFKDIGTFWQEQE